MADSILTQIDSNNISIHDKLNYFATIICQELIELEDFLKENVYLKNKFMYTNRLTNLICCRDKWVTLFLTAYKTGNHDD